MLTLLFSGFSMAIACWPWGAYLGEEGFERDRGLHVVDLRAAEQPAHVVGEPEHRGSEGGVVGADALEHPPTVMQRRGQDVDGRLVPVHVLAVHPDLAGRLDRHIQPPCPVRGLRLIAPAPWIPGRRWSSLSTRSPRAVWRRRSGPRSPEWSIPQHLAGPL